MILYGLKNCDTCRKALRALQQVKLRDVREDGLPQNVLDEALKRFGPKLLNTRSTTWRSLDEAARGTAPRELLRVHPALMKRPLIVSGDVSACPFTGQMWLGWDAEVQAALL